MIIVKCPDCDRPHDYLRLNVTIHCECGREITRTEQLELKNETSPDPWEPQYYVLELNYPLGTEPQDPLYLDEAIESLVGRPRDESGTGFGYRDMAWHFTSYEEAQKFRFAVEEQFNTRLSYLGVSSEYLDAESFITTMLDTSEPQPPKVLTFLKWCIEDFYTDNGTPPERDLFWAYYHAAHVHNQGGPIS